MFWIGLPESSTTLTTKGSANCSFFSPVWLSPETFSKINTISLEVALNVTGEVEIFSPALFFTRTSIVWLSKLSPKVQETLAKPSVSVFVVDVLNEPWPAVILNSTSTSFITRPSLSATFITIGSVNSSFLTPDWLSPETFSKKISSKFMVKVRLDLASFSPSL